MYKKIFIYFISILLFTALLPHNVFADGISCLRDTLPDDFPTSIDDENSSVQWIKSNTDDTDYVITLFRNDEYLVVGDQNIPLDIHYSHASSNHEHLIYHFTYDNLYNIDVDLKKISKEEKELAIITIINIEQDYTDTYVPLTKITELSLNIDDSILKLGSKPSDLYNSIATSDNINFGTMIFCGRSDNSTPYFLNSDDELVTGTLYNYFFEIYPKHGYTFEKAHEIDSDNHSIEDNTVLKSIKMNSVECLDCFEFEEYYKEVIYYSDFFAFYDVVEGNDKTINADENQDVTFKSNATCEEYIDGVKEEFQGVSVSHKENISNETNLIQEGDYEVSDDYKTITIKKEFLSKLEADTYDLTINYKYGKATTSFEIIKEQKPEPTPKPEHKEESHKESDSTLKYNIPKTGIY